MMQALLPMLSCCLLAVADGPEVPLLFATTDEFWIQDSLPKEAGERIVLHSKYLEAHWVVILVNLPYEQSRTQVRELVHEAFGIESEREMTTAVQTEQTVDPNMPREPLFGDGFSGFRAIGVPVTEAREYRIQSKQYNNQLKRKSYSQSEWRIIDGSRLFGKTCTMLVVSRIDHSREWAWMHPGIPLPFKVTGDTKLVTDKELTLVEKLVQDTGHPQALYFVPNTGYKTNGVLNVMTAILDAVKELPETSSTSRDS